MLYVSTLRCVVWTIFLEVFLEVFFNVHFIVFLGVHTKAGKEHTLCRRLFYI